MREGVENFSDNSEGVGPEAERSKQYVDDPTHISWPEVASAQINISVNEFLKKRSGMPTPEDIDQHGNLSGAYMDRVRNYFEHSQVKYEGNENRIIEQIRKNVPDLFLASAGIEAPPLDGADTGKAGDASTGSDLERGPIISKKVKHGFLGRFFVSGNPDRAKKTMEEVLRGDPEAVAQRRKELYEGRSPSVADTSVPSPGEVGEDAERRGHMAELYKRFGAQAVGHAMTQLSARERITQPTPEQIEQKIIELESDGQAKVA